MKRATTIITAIALSINAMSAGLTFSNVNKTAISETPPSSTGLDEVYILYNTRGAIATYTAQNNSQVHWHVFSSLGGAYAEELTPTREGNRYSVSIGDSDKGYIIEDGTRRYYYWIVNYANHQAHIEGISLTAEQECDITQLEFVGNAEKIPYYTINGQQKELDRGIVLSYYTLRYDENAEVYEQEKVEKSMAYVGHIINCEAPLCDTEFTLSGDKYLTAWNMGQEAVSHYFKTPRVEAHTSATQKVRENDNEKKVETGLGGSAPCDIDFKAVCTDAAMFKEWQLSRNADFEPIDLRYNTEDFNYVFRENGMSYVRFVANNAAGSCEYISNTYEVFVGESALECPNAFSPQNQDGVNDEWKVSYKSLLTFECHIFNKWGQRMASFTDPSQGWDGRYGGKFVPTGVYYYVIKATGSDGKKYNLSGDINIIGTSTKPNSGSESDLGAE